MFLAVVLICTVEGECSFRSVQTVYPTLFHCELVLEVAVEHFNAMPKIDFAEGRCIRSGNLTGA
jgi:hypothetical protein